MRDRIASVWCFARSESLAVCADHSSLRWSRRSSFNAFEPSMFRNASLNQSLYGTVATARQRAANQLGEVAYRLDECIRAHRVGTARHVRKQSKHPPGACARM